MNSDIPCNNCGVKFSEFEKLQAENKKLRECVSILRDFRTTKECQRTWVDEMQGTIEAVLEELDSIK